MRMNVYREIRQIWIRIVRMALNFQRLETEVSEMSTVIDGVVLLLTSLASEIRDNAANQAKIEEIATNLDTKANALAAAAVVGTPAETPPSGGEPAAARRV
jgi:hypothetical protein